MRVHKNLVHHFLSQINKILLSYPYGRNGITILAIYLRQKLTFITLCLLSVLLLYIKKDFIENETAAFEFLQDRPEGMILQAISALQFFLSPGVPVEVYRNRVYYLGGVFYIRFSYYVYPVLECGNGSRIYFPAG